MFSYEVTSPAQLVHKKRIPKETRALSIVSPKNTQKVRLKTKCVHAPIYVLIISLYHLKIFIQTKQNL